MVDPALSDGPPVLTFFVFWVSYSVRNLYPWKMSNISMLYPDEC